MLQARDGGKRIWSFSYVNYGNGCYSPVPIISTGSFESEAASYERQLLADCFP